jgi:class 3 adenylate cyclase
LRAWSFPLSSIRFLGHSFLLPVRYLKVSLLIGLLASLLVAALFEWGALRPLDQGLANLLGLRFSPVSGRATQYPLFILLAFGIAWTTIDIPRNSLKVVVAAGALAQVLAAAWILHLLGGFFSPFAGALAIGVSFLLGFAYSQSESGSRKRVARAIFGDRISGRTFHALIDSSTPLRFEGEMREATVVVCEIFNHDQLADALPVTDYVALNNSFLRNAADFLVERGGYLDECDGESLRVVFGTPLPDPRHAVTACEAALALAARLEEVNHECLRVWKQAFDFRIGINSGEMVVAAYGSRRLGAFSVAGEPVEWARRLCAANTIYGSRILLGSATFQLAEPAVEVRPMELVQRHPQDREREEVYELLAGKNALSDLDLERRDLFWKGIVYFRERRWDDALAHFRLAWADDIQDPPLEFYLRRVEQLREGAPALDWNSARI